MTSTHDSPTGWYKELQSGEKRTFWACFGGWALDAMDVQIFFVAQFLDLSKARIKAHHCLTEFVTYSRHLNIGCLYALVQVVELLAFAHVAPLLPIHVTAPRCLKFLAPRKPTGA